MFYEPGGDPVNGPWSDIFGIVAGGPDGLNLAFSSDVDNIPFFYGGLPNMLVVEEPPGPYDMTMYLHPDLRAAGYHATFASTEVPIPASCLLFLSGLIGMVAIKRQFA